jgi:hypothetical protein
MKVNYHGKSFVTLAHGSNNKYRFNFNIKYRAVIYHGISSLEKCRYCGNLPWYFYNIGPLFTQQTKHSNYSLISFQTVMCKRPLTVLLLTVEFCSIITCLTLSCKNQTPLYPLHYFGSYYHRYPFF